MTIKPTRAAMKLRASAGIGRTIVALVVALAIFLAIAVFVVVNPGDSGPPGLSDHRAVSEDIDAAREFYSNVSGTAAEHVRRGHELAAAGTPTDLLAAYEEYRKAMALDGESVDALMGIAAIALDLERAGAPFTLQRALAYCDAVAQVYPDEPRPHRVRARISMSMKGFEAGADAWARVLEIYPQDSEALLELGRCLMEVGHHDQAVAHLGRSIALGGETTDARLLLAETHCRAGEPGRALEALQQVPREGRHGARAAVAMSDILVEVGNEASARSQVRQALRYDGNQPGALLRDAVYRYQDEGGPEAARENLLRLLEQPDIDRRPALRDAAALHLGTIYRLEGAVGRAHRYLDPLVARERTHMPAQFQVAKLALAEGNAVDRVGPYSLLLEEVQCTESRAWFLAGQLALQVDDLSLGMGAFQKAIELDPGFAPATFSLIHILVEYGNVAEVHRLVTMLYAQAEQRPLLQRRQREFYDPFDLGVLQESLERTVSAIEQARPGEDDHTRLRALFHYHSGDHERADALFDSLARSRRGEPIHRLYQGMMALSAGRYDKASRHFADAAEQAPTRALYLYLEGRMLEEEGRADRAAERYEHLATYNPGHVLAEHGAARLKHRLGDRDGAGELYARAHAADADFLPAWRDHLLLDMGQPLIPGVL